MALLNMHITPEMKAEIAHMDQLRKELEQLEEKYSGMFNSNGVTRVKDIIFVDPDAIINDSNYEMDEYLSLSWSDAVDFSCVTEKTDLDDTCKIDSVLKHIKKVKEIYTSFEELLTQQKELGAKYMVAGCEPDEFNFNN